MTDSEKLDLILSLLQGTRVVNNPTVSVARADSSPDADGIYRFQESQGSLLEQYFVPDKPGAERVYVFAPLRPKHAISISGALGGVGHYDGFTASLYNPDGTLLTDIPMAGDQASVWIDNLNVGAWYTLKVTMLGGGAVVVQPQG